MAQTCVISSNPRGPLPSLSIAASKACEPLESAHAPLLSFSPQEADRAAALSSEDLFCEATKSTALIPNPSPALAEAHQPSGPGPSGSCSAAPTISPSPPLPAAAAAVAAVAAAESGAAPVPRPRPAEKITSLPRAAAAAGAGMAAAAEEADKNLLLEQIRLASQVWISSAAAPDSVSSTGCQSPSHSLADSPICLSSAAPLAACGTRGLPAEAHFVEAAAEGSRETRVASSWQVADDRRLLQRVEGMEGMEEVGTSDGGEEGGVATGCSTEQFDEDACSEEGSDNSWGDWWLPEDEMFAEGSGETEEEGDDEGEVNNEVRGAVREEPLTCAGEMAAAGLPYPELSRAAAQMLPVDEAGRSHEEHPLWRDNAAEGTSRVGFWLRAEEGSNCGQNREVWAVGTATDMMVGGSRLLHGAEVAHMRGCAGSSAAIEAAAKGGLPEAASWQQDERGEGGLAGETSGEWHQQMEQQSRDIQCSEDAGALEQLDDSGDDGMSSTGIDDASNHDDADSVDASDELLLSSEAGGGGMLGANTSRSHHFDFSNDAASRRDESLPAVSCSGAVLPQMADKSVDFPLFTAGASGSSQGRTVAPAVPAGTSFSIHSRSSAHTSGAAGISLDLYPMSAAAREAVLRLLEQTQCAAQGGDSAGLSSGGNKRDRPMWFEHSPYPAPMSKAARLLRSQLDHTTSGSNL